MTKHLVDVHLTIEVHENDIETSRDLVMSRVNEALSKIEDIEGGRIKGVLIHVQVMDD